MTSEKVSLPASGGWDAGLRRHLELYHRAKLEDFVPTRVKGYWQRKTPCGGARGGCREPLHGCLFNEGPICHSVSYRDPTRTPDGRWVSPFRTWRQAVAAAEAAGEELPE
jgi:hypothetical protein